MERAIEGREQPDPWGGVHFPAADVCPNCRGEAVLSYETGLDILIGVAREYYCLDCGAKWMPVNCPVQLPLMPVNHQNEIWGPTEADVNNIQAWRHESAMPTAAGGR